jgi:hypothetical protein
MHGRSRPSPNKRLLCSNNRRRTAQQRQRRDNCASAPYTSDTHALCIISYRPTQHSTTFWTRWTRTRLLTRRDELHVICCRTITTTSQLSSLLLLTYRARHTPCSSQCWPHRKHAHSLALAITSVHLRLLLRTHPSNHQLCHT